MNSNVGQGNSSVQKSDNEWSTVRKGVRRRCKQGDESKLGVMRYQTFNCTSERRRKHRSTASLVVDVQRLLQLQIELEQTRWWSDTRQILLTALRGQTVSFVQCLGIGSFEKSHSAVHQLACAISLRDLVKASSCSVSDPAMTQADIKLVIDLGLTFSPPVAVDTVKIKEGCGVLFMPHCGKKLNLNIVQRWTERMQLGNLVYIGNILSSYLLDDDLNSEALAQLITQKLLVEKRCPDAKLSTLEVAFNDLAVIYIRNSQLEP